MMRIDGLESNLEVKKSARVATNGPITLSGLQTIDGVSLAEGDRVLVKNQSDAVTNGIYVVSSGAWERAFDARDARGVTAGLSIQIDDGTEAETSWALTTKNPVLGITSLLFVKTGDPVRLQQLSDVYDEYVADTGIVARTSDGSLNHLSITGETNQITVSNGDGSADVSISLPAELVLPGSVGVKLPSGTTASRSSSTVGTIRYNTDRAGLELSTPSGWEKIASLTDKAIKNANVLIVSNDPGEGQFSSIKAAVDSISDSSSTNQYLVVVLPGSYTEDEIDVPQFVIITGINEYAVNVFPTTSTQNIFNLGSGSSLTHLSVNDVGEGYSAITAFDNEHSVLVHKVGTYNCGVGFYHKASTHDSTIYLEYSDSTGGTIHFKSESSNGFVAYSNLENFYSYSSDAGVNPDFGVYLTGTTTRMNVQAFGMEGGDNSAGIAFYVQDGAHCDIKAGSIFGWNKGIQLANTGAASEANLMAVDLHDNVQDLSVDHPSANGSLNGSADRLKVSINSASTFTVSYSDPINDGFITTGSLYVGTKHSNIADVTSLITRGMQLGLMDGGVLTRGTGLNVNVSAGSGYLLKSNGIDLVNVTWSSTSVAVADNKNQYVYITIDGDVMSSESIPDTSSNIVLGRLLTLGGAIPFIGSSGSLHISTFNPNIDKLMRNAIGSLYVSGSIVTENASNARHLDITNGDYFYSSTEMQPVGGTNVSMLIGHNSSGVPSYTIGQTVDNAYYDDGTNLAAIPTGKFTAHVLYTIGSGSTTGYALSYGREVYDTLEDAIAAPLSSPIIPPEGSPHIAKIIVQEGQTNIAQIMDIRPVFGASGQSTVSSSKHGDLLGLDADDHLQYMPLTGSRAMTGQLDMGTNAIVNASTVNGINVASHASRHLPNGADPLTTAAAVTISGSTSNGVGIANSLARSDHSHALGTDVWTASNHPTTISGYGIGDLTSSVRTSISATGSLAYNNSTGVFSYTTPSTDGITEGSNLYFTTARARGAISASGSLSYNSSTGVLSYTTPSSDGITEGTNNLYFTAARARLSLSASGSLSYNNATGVISYTTPTTSGISEGSNLYFTTARARSSISAGGQLSYDSGTGVVSFTTPAITGDVSISAGGTTATLANSGVTAGSYNEVNVNSKGLVTAATFTTRNSGQVIVGTVAAQTNTTAIPYDTTVPLSTEGTQLMSQAVVPQASTAKFIIEMTGMIDSGTASRTITFSVFRGSTFIGAVSNFFPSATQVRAFALKIIDAPGTTSSTTYSIRIGTSTSGSAWYLGRGATATLGGTNPTGWTITEVLA